MLKFLFFIALTALTTKGILAAKCQKCQTTEGECETGQCEGQFCIAHFNFDAKNTANSVSSRKSCTSHDPRSKLQLSGEQGCKYVETAGGDIRNLTCFCQTDNCTTIPNLREFANSDIDYFFDGRRGNVPEVKCRNCTGTSGNCETGECSGYWCLLAINFQNATPSVPPVYVKQCYREDPRVELELGDSDEEGCKLFGFTDGPSQLIKCACRSDSCNTDEHMRTIPAYKALVDKLAQNAPGACLLEQQRIGESGTISDGYVPQCTAKGNYKRMQCNSSKCWCVRRKTGSKIPGSERPLSEGPLDCRAFFADRLRANQIATTVKSTDSPLTGSVKCLNCSQATEDCNVGECSGNYCMSQFSFSPERGYAASIKMCGTSSGPWSMSTEDAKASLGITGTEGCRLGDMGKFNSTILQCMCQTDNCTNLAYLRKFPEVNKFFGDRKISVKSSTKCYNCTDTTDCQTAQCNGGACSYQLYYTKGVPQAVYGKHCIPGDIHMYPGLATGTETEGCRLEQRNDGLDMITCGCTDDLCNTDEYLQKIPAYKAFSAEMRKSTGRAAT